VTDFADRVPPQDLEAEAAVLGSMILDNACIADVVTVLDAGDFYSNRHALVFSAILRLWEQRKPVDLVTLRDDLLQDNHLADIGGLETLTELLETVPSAANATHYGDIVTDKALLRQVIEKTVASLREAHGGDMKGADVLSRAQSALLGITLRRSSDACDMASALRGVFDELNAVKGNHAVTGIPSGLYDLDNLVGGWKPGEVVVIAARPSMGKTALALQAALDAAHDGKHILYFSLEMGTSALVHRLLALEAKVDAGKMRRGYLDSESWGRIDPAIANLSTAPLFIDDTSSMTPTELRGKIIRHAARHKLDLVAIDYLQLMTHANSRENRQQEVSSISREVKAIARDMNIPILLVSQLNRAAEGRGDNKPKLSDLRESGAIEQDADVVILIYRPGYYNGNQEDREAQLIVAKHRNGPTGIARAVFFAERTQFTNEAFEHEPAGERT